MNGGSRPPGASPPTEATPPPSSRSKPLPPLNPSSRPRSLTPFARPQQTERSASGTSVSFDLVRLRRLPSYRITLGRTGKPGAFIAVAGIAVVIFLLYRREPRPHRRGPAQLRRGVGFPLPVATGETAQAVATTSPPASCRRVRPGSWCEVVWASTWSGSPIEPPSSAGSAPGPGQPRRLLLHAGERSRLGPERVHHRRIPLRVRRSGPGRILPHM
jgi:hypothetical protein